MADLIDRISGISLSQSPPRPKINVHAWIGMQRLYALNVLTRTQVGTEFDIIGNVDEERQATQIANQIDAQSNATTKTIYVGRVEAVLLCVESARISFYRNPDGTVNKPLVFSHLQIVG